MLSNRAWSQYWHVANTCPACGGHTGDWIAHRGHEMAGIVVGSSIHIHGMGPRRYLIGVEPAILTHYWFINCAGGTGSLASEVRCDLGGW